MNTLMLDKINLFEAFLGELVNWFCEVNNCDVDDFNSHPNNDLSKLKVIKLHFFACSTTNDALDIFNDFHAMPYGHVETDVYNGLNNMKFFKITKSRMEIEPEGMEFLKLNLDEEYKIAKVMVKNLKYINMDLIKYKAFDLVELSHKWFSWRYTFKEARQANSYSKKINPDLIKEEKKYYNIF